LVSHCWGRIQKCRSKPITIDNLWDAYRQVKLETLKKFFEQVLLNMSDKNQEYQRNVNEQSGVEGQRKEVDVGDYPKAAALGRLLKDIDFPSDKQGIIQHVQQRTGNNADAKDILTTLKNIEDKQYRNVAEVTKAAGVVQ
jgi:Protein of unknown function (DUF2795)